MIKKLVVSICLLFAVVSFAQEGTSSPYSFYGIGDVKFKGTVDNRSMGGLSIFRDSIHIKRKESPMNLILLASFVSLPFTRYRKTKYSCSGSYPKILSWSRWK